MGTATESDHTASDRNLFAEERRQRILDELDRSGRIIVNDLSDRFGVSTATLRNDLRDLESAGLLQRTHGGAVPSAREQVIVEHSAEAALSENQAAKIAIGRRAAEFVRDGDTLFCDSGSTTIELVRACANRRGLSIITNDYIIAAEAERLLTDVSIMLLGGNVRNGFHYTMGASTVQMLQRLSAPLAFLAASAFSSERGFTVHTLELATFKRTLLERADRRIVLMDSSKFDHFTTVSYADLPDVDVLVTDDGISAADRQLVERATGGPELVIA